MVEAASLVNVSKHYSNGVKALSNVSLMIPQGKCLVLLGPNGAGKTTLIKVITRLLSPNEGVIHAPSPHRIGVALQEIGLWPHLTLDENLTFVGKLYRISLSALDEKKRELLQKLELDEYRHQRFEALSDGLKRRLNLACALISSPELLILDEPSLGLDVHARLLLWKYLEKLLQKESMTLLLCTHDMEEADRLGEQVVVMDQGKVLAIDSPLNLKLKYGLEDEINLKISPGSSYSPQLLAAVAGVSQASCSNGRIRLLVRNAGQHLPRILKELDKNNVQVQDVNLRPTTLADAFLELTGHPLEDRV